MKRILTMLLVAFIVPTVCVARQLGCSLDFAQFRHDDTKTRWELYYSFPDTAPKYVRQNNGAYMGSLYCLIEITSVSLTQPVRMEWIVDNSTDVVPTNNSRNLVGVKSFVLSAGEYNVRFHLHDLNDTSSSSSTTFPIIISTFPRNRLTMSDLQLASFIIPESSLKGRKINAQFVKNSLYTAPNPQKEYIGSSPVLALYSEIYNAKKYLKDSMISDYRVYDGAKRQILRQTFRRAVTADMQVETAQIPLTELPSGLYYISLNMQPVDGGADTVTATEKFYVLNPAIPPQMRSSYTEDELFQSSEFATLSPERTEEEFQKAKYIANRQEVDLYKSLTETLAKQKFLYRFWKVRDPDPDTFINEKLEEYRENIRFADVNYGNLQIKQGWKTDKGRILLRYGKPSQVDRYYSVAETRPYEIWFYSHLQGGIQFSFVDITGYGHFILVHSTALGELRNEQWIDQYVRITPSSGNESELPSTPR